MATNLGSVDVDAYLRRVGVARPPAPTAAALSDLHRAHLAAIGFDNVDVLLGGTLSLELADIEAKLVGAGHGGLCFEHALLFAAVLEQLGFAVDRLLARVTPDADPPGTLTHMTLRVAAEGRDFISDVGFGMSPPVPIELRDGAVAAGDPWGHSLHARADGTWALRTSGREHDSWVVALTPVPLVDVMVANHFVCTHRQSPFTGALVTMRSEADEQRAIVGRMLRTGRPGEDEAREALDDDALRAVLTGSLDLHRSEAELDRVVALARCGAKK